MDGLREKLERALAEHQRESGLHMIGGCEKLIQRLLFALRSAAIGRGTPESNLSDPHGDCP